MIHLNQFLKLANKLENNQKTTSPHQRLNHLTAVPCPAGGIVYEDKAYADDFEIFEGNPLKLSN